MEDCRDWILLADASNDALAWLQCTTRRDVAMAVVSPRRFVPDYQLRVSRSELATLRLTDSSDAEVLAIVGIHDGQVTLNLKAPLVIHLAKRVGRQVVANGDESLQHLVATPPNLRQAA